MPDDVCKMVAISSRSQHVNSLWPNNTITMTLVFVNTGSGNGLLPDGTKPLPEPMLTYHQGINKVFCHSFQDNVQLHTGTNTQGQWVKVTQPLLTHILTFLSNQVIPVTRGYPTLFFCTDTDPEFIPSQLASRHS